MYTINVIDTPILNTDQIIDGGLTSSFIVDIVLSILGYVAEQERTNIKQRQKEGIESAKKAGKRFGRPSKFSNKFNQINATVQKREISVTEACGLLGISRKTYYNHKNLILSKSQVNK